MPTENPPAFTAAVDAYLAPSRDQFNYEQMRLTFLDVERFRRWADVVEGLHALAGARVLSSGCGFAGSLVAYRDAGAAAAVGVDVDPEFLGLAVKRTAALPGTGVVHYDGRRLPFADHTFDVIESMDVVEHTPDVGTYLAELLRVLAPDGLILLVTPNRLWPVEQHLGIAGPPWLTIGVADRFFTGLAKLPGLSKDRRFKYERLRGMRTQNISLRRLRRHAVDLGLHLSLLDPAEHGAQWPLPHQDPRLERLALHRFGKFVAPTKTLVATLQRTPPGGVSELRR